MLTIQNAHERDAQIQFYEEGHIYDINGDQSFTSVTTIISKLHEKFDADKTIAKMRRNIQNVSNKYYGKTDDQIKEEWNNTGTKAALLGTKMHYNIECFYNGEDMPNKLEMIELFDFFDHFHCEHILPKGYKPYRTEWFVFDELLKIAGSIDMVFQDQYDPDLLHIYDWKRTKNLETSNSYKNMYPPVSHLPDSNFWHYSLQLNIYRHILTQKYNKRIGTMFLVVLHENNTEYKVTEVPRLETEIEEIMKLRTVDFLTSK